MIKVVSGISEISTSRALSTQITRALRKFALKRTQTLRYLSLNFPILNLSRSLSLFYFSLILSPNAPNGNDKGENEQQINLNNPFPKRNFEYPLVVAYSFFFFSF